MGDGLRIGFVVGGRLFAVLERRVAFGLALVAHFVHA